MDQLAERLVGARERLRDCGVCPRDCRVDCRADHTGVCKIGRLARVSSDYAGAARSIIKAMHQQVGEVRVDEDAPALHAVLVRHLVMPVLLEGTRSVLRWLATELSSDTMLIRCTSTMPCTKLRQTAISRKSTDASPALSFARPLAYAEEAGLWRPDVRDPAA